MMWPRFASLCFSKKAGRIGVDETATDRLIMVAATGLSEGLAQTDGRNYFWAELLAFSRRLRAGETAMRMQYGDAAIGCPREGDCGISILDHR